MRRTGYDGTEARRQSRRAFMQTAGLTLTGLMAAGSALEAQDCSCSGTCSETRPDAIVPHLIPAEKNLHPDWVRSLYERGKPEVYSAARGELKYIGLPIGGMACGQLYLGGDGRLWLWHIFRTVYSREKDHGQRFASMTLGGHYADPDKVFTREKRPVEQGMALRVVAAGKEQVRTLDARGFRDIQFRGEYPVGRVTYRDQACPVEVELEAFSPFIPLNPEDSALPATLMTYTVKNRSNGPVQADVAGWLENAVCPYEKRAHLGRRRNRLVQRQGRLTLHSTAEALMVKRSPRQDVVFETFDDDYVKWTATGKAFGKRPYPLNEAAPHQPLQKVQGSGLVNSHNARAIPKDQRPNPAAWSQAADRLTGTLTSEPFAIERNYIAFSISGGSHAGKTCMNLLVDGKVVRTQAGHNSNTLQRRNFDVRDLQGQQARLQIVDTESGGWGHVGIDQIVFTDQPAVSTRLEDQHGYGSMALSLVHAQKPQATTELSDSWSPEDLFGQLGVPSEDDGATRPLDKPLIGALGESMTLQPGQSGSVTFLLTWYFPHLNQQENETGQLLDLIDIRKLSRHYRKRFTSADQVADYVTGNFDRLAGHTRLWNRTWYDSTLPYWLLDRTFIPNDCLATNTVNWFDSGRFWGWEGVECCPGTCQHVWHYAQGLARIFPQIERGLREDIDFGLAQLDNGGMGHRGPDTAGNYGRSVAHDGHCGTILRAYREHLTSPDSAYLKRMYPRIKKAVQYIIREDKDRDGLLEGPQHNTLDATWEGPMGWISSLYLAAMAVGQTLAQDMGDEAFAAECAELIQRGRTNIVKQLFNGEYFIHKPPDFRRTNTNDGCHIDQVLGQGWLWQVGLGGQRVVPSEECRSALGSIYRYNYAPDAWDYMKKHTTIKGARVYATAGEAGTVMCTWPHGGDDKAVPGMDKRSDDSPVWQGPGGYLDECMNGFEYQIAGHMIWEGLVQEGLVLTRSVHDRYHASKRNPYNEIECGDHYSRSMAAYGVFLGLCGFEYHGPKGHLGFAPRLTPEDFKAPFTTAEGWGTFEQRWTGETLNAGIALHWGRLRLKSLALTLPERAAKTGIDRVTVNGQAVETYKRHGGKIQIRLKNELTIDADQTATVCIATGHV